MHGECGGKAGRAECHRVAQRETGGQWYHRVRSQPRVFGETAIASLAETGAGDHHFIACLETCISARHHGARRIDTGNQREFAQDLAGAGYCQRILVIDA